MKQRKINSTSDTKIFIGVSTNHKTINGEHNKVRFKNKWLSLKEIVEHIEEDGYFYPPITNIEEGKLNGTGYGVHYAYSFTETNLIPFDIDSGKYPMETFLAKIPQKLLPTIIFKTRSNDEEKGEYRYRMMYLFIEPFRTRERYYSAYEAIKNDIKGYTGDFGKDEYAYGLNPDGNGRKGSCCKPVRTNRSSDIVVYGHIYSEDEFFIPTIFADLDYEHSEKINRELFSPMLYDWVMKYHRYDAPYEDIPFRDFSVTKSEFNNGFAFVRGNYSYAEYIRKFIPMKNDEDEYVKNPETGRICYSPSKWAVREHRHRKLWQDALIARFNDFMDNGECTLTGDELFMVLYDEAHKWFVVYDTNGNDIISNKFLLETASEALSMDIKDVIAEVVEYNKKWDNRKQCKRQTCRVDYKYWKDNGSILSKDKIKLLARQTAKFLQILELYNPQKTLAENVEYMDKIQTDWVPPHSLSTLSKFIKDCRKIEKYMDKDGAISDEELKEILFSNEGLVTDMTPHFCKYVHTFFTDKVYNIQFQNIINASGSCYWEQVKSGAKVKPKNGRPKSVWQNMLMPEDCKLTLGELVNKIHSMYPDVNKSSIKTWRHRQLKKLGE